MLPLGTVESRETSGDWSRRVGVVYFQQLSSLQSS